MTPPKRWLLVSAVAAVAVYALLWVGYVLQWKWLTTMDSSALETTYRFGVARPGWVSTWNVICTVLGPGLFRIAGVVVIIVMLWRRNVRVALFVLLSVEVSGLVVVLAKHASDRPRPATAMVDVLETAFPSGHALGVMVGVLAYSAIVWPAVRPSLRVWIGIVGAAVVVVIGIGRVVLNVHHPSDVLAGWALGYAYFVVCLLLVPPSRPVTAADETLVAPGNSR